MRKTADDGLGETNKMHLQHVLSRIMTLVTITASTAFPADAKHSFTLDQKERNEIVVFDLFQNEATLVCMKTTLH
jgi:hypothetical protein